jgi:hypothetical protein
MAGSIHRLAGAPLAAMLASLLASGCGHPATRAECEEIFARTAELELRSQRIVESKAIAERTAAVRSARGDELIQQCTGKKISARALACVRQAASSADVDRCLD